jgi:uncharacterized protein (TIGR02588 family)
MSSKKRNRKPAPRTVAEKVSLFVSLLVIASVLGLVLYLWFVDSHRPALLRIERGAIEHEGEQFQVPVTVINEGGSTATDVVIEGRVEVEGREENSTISFDFIPANSQSEGVMIFSSDPSQAKVRVTSYRKP